MSAKGAKYMWREGKILHAARHWKAPSMRRVPRIMIEDRALEVGILMYLEEPWMVFEETRQLAEEIDLKGGIQLTEYFKQYHLLPGEIDKEDTYKWLKDPKHALLLWGRNSHYFVKKAVR